MCLSRSVNGINECVCHFALAASVFLTVSITLERYQVEGTSIQGDHISMAVGFWYLLKSGFLRYMCIVAYTGQVTFYKVQENTAMFNWSPCKPPRNFNKSCNLYSLSDVMIS